MFRGGDRKGKPVTPPDVPLSSPSGDQQIQLVQAIAMDPTTEVLRDKSRLNGLVLVRLEESTLSEQTRANAADGIVAYSSVCTHQGCSLQQWVPEKQTFKCFCHFSEFEAANFGKPLKGPAVRKLAMLPLRIEDNVLKVVGKFTGRVGFKK